MAANTKASANIATGEVAGTGSAFNIICGFKPKHLCILNRTRNVRATWNDVMPDASAQLVVDSGVGTTDLSFITTNGITPLFNGFTLGSNASMNTASDVIYWTAFK
jgi:hypothetical protein